MGDNEINERRVRISNGLANIPDYIPLNMGQDLEIILCGTVVKIEESDNQNGTSDITYVVKCMEVLNVNGEEIC